MIPIAPIGAADQRTASTVPQAPISIASASATEAGIRS